MAVAVARPLQLDGCSSAPVLHVHRRRVVVVPAPIHPVLDAPAGHRHAGRESVVFRLLRELVAQGDAAALAVGQRLGRRHIERVAVEAAAVAVLVAGEPSHVPPVRAGAVLPHHAQVVVVLEPQVVAGTEPEAVRRIGQQPERDLLDARAQLGIRAGIPSRPRVVNGVEAVVPAVLQGERCPARTAPRLAPQQLQVRAGRVRIVEPAVAEAHGTTQLQTVFSDGSRCCRARGKQQPGHAARDDGPCAHATLLIHERCASLRPGAGPRQTRGPRDCKVPVRMLCFPATRRPAATHDRIRR